MRRRRVNPDNAKEAASRARMKARAKAVEVALEAAYRGVILDHDSRHVRAVLADLYSALADAGFRPPKG